MLTLASALAAHFASENTTLTVCWTITRNDAVVLRGTAHDRTVRIPSGDYAGDYRAAMAVTSSDLRSASDGAPQNLEVEGGFQVDASIPDLTVEDIEAGLYDQAAAALFIVNWASPGDGQKELLVGTLGEFYRDSDGLYRTEVRGLTQALAQQMLQTYSERCNVREFGDSRCGFDVGAVTRTATVTSVTDRKHFEATLDAGPAPVNSTYYDGGRLAFTSGDNDGFVREVRSAVVAGSDLTVELWDEAPADIAVSDTISLPPGCDRRYETCRDVHVNLENFRGHGVFASGRDRLMAGPPLADQTGEWTP